MPAAVAGAAAATAHCPAAPTPPLFNSTPLQSFFFAASTSSASHSSNSASSLLLVRAFIVVLLLLMPAGIGGGGSRLLPPGVVARGGPFCDPEMALLPPPTAACQRSAKNNINNSSQCLLRFDELHKETFCRHVVTNNNYNNDNYYNNSDRASTTTKNWSSGSSTTKRSSRADTNWSSGPDSSSFFHDDVRLSHCCGHRLRDSISPAARQDYDSCLRHVDVVLALDKDAARLSCHFARLLTRYDCRQPYSVRTGCADCQEAYRQWVCSTMVPHWTTSGHRLKPCKSLCHQVEQTCPFFLPGDRAPAYPTQYAGEPTFLCLDPNIPETGAQLLHSVHGPTDCCYQPCQGAVCPPPPSEAACLRSGSQPPPLDSCGDATPHPPPYASGNPCVVATTTTAAAAATSRPRLALVLVLLHVTRWRAASRTMFTTPK